MQDVVVVAAKRVVIAALPEKHITLALAAVPKSTALAAVAASNVRLTERISP